MAGRGAGATYAVASADLSFKAGPPVLLSPDGTRLDGRAAKECRTAFMQVGAVSGAAGSGYVELGQTKVIVSVFGPRESKKAEAFSDQGRLNCAVEFTSFATSTRGKASQDKELSSLLHKALEGAVQVHTFPKTTVDVFALILQSGGGELHALISCASLALADAGIGMNDLVTAVSASCVGQQLLLDSTAQEERWEDGGMTLAYMPSRNEVTYFNLTGEWSVQRASQSMELCLDACRKLAGVLTVCLKESELNAFELATAVFDSLPVVADKMGTQAPWRKLLLNSMDSNAHLKHSKWFQLATVRPDGKPANRTVVFRGFVDGTDKLQFTTDSRTAKVDQIKAHNYGEICWYFTDSWEQFRLLGVLDIIDSTTTDPTRLSLREKVWFESSSKSRSQFAGPHPRLPWVESSPGPEVQSDQGALDTFCLVTLEPEEVDYLHLKENKRVVYSRLVQGVDQTVNWKDESVNP